jgi:hypothetical protein
MFIIIRLVSDYIHNWIIKNILLNVAVEVSIPASYLGHLRLKSRSRNKLSWHKAFAVFLCHSRQMLEKYLETDHFFLPHPFQYIIHKFPYPTSHRKQWKSSWQIEYRLWQVVEQHSCCLTPDEYLVHIFTILQKICLWKFLRSTPKKKCNRTVGAL